MSLLPIIESSWMRALHIGENPALQDTVSSIEEDLKEETGLDIRLPVNEKGAEVLLVG